MPTTMPTSSTLGVCFIIAIDPRLGLIESPIIAILFFKWSLCLPCFSFISHQPSWVLFYSFWARNISAPSRASHACRWNPLHAQFKTATGAYVLMFTVLVGGIVLTYWAFTKIIDRSRRGYGDYDLSMEEESLTWVRHNFEYDGLLYLKQGSLLSESLV